MGKVILKWMFPSLYEQAERMKANERVAKKVSKENKNLAKYKVNIQSGRLFVDGRELCGTGSHSVCHYCKTRCTDAMQMTMTGQLCACIHPDEFKAQSFDKI